MPQNKKHDILERRNKVADLYRKGFRQYEIAAKVGVSENQITNDLKAIRAKWMEDSIRNFDEAISEQLAKIDLLEREYWLAYEQSKKDYKQKSQKTKGTGQDILSREVMEKEIIQFGDPRYLQGVQWCIERRCKLMGLDAPIRNINLNIEPPENPYKELSKEEVIFLHSIGKKIHGERKADT